MQNQPIYTQDIQTPLISFIVTTYNLPIDYLKECLNSILQLSLNPKEREIILVDDGSDVCPIDDLQTLFPNIIYLQQPNQGVSVARNYGMQLAKGKFIQFVDGDDYLVQVEYEHCLNLLRYNNPDIVTFQHTTGKLTENRTFELPTCISGTQYLSSYNLHGAVWSYIFRRAIVGSLLFTPGIIYGEDEEFTPQLFLRAERIFKLNIGAYFYRDNKQSVSHQQSKGKMNQRMDNTLTVIINLQKLLDTIPVEDRRALNRRIAQLSMDYLYNCIRLKHSFIALNKAIKTLREHGLYPLPQKEYTKKYTLFRKLISTYVGRIILLLLIKK